MIILKITNTYHLIHVMDIFENQKPPNKNVELENQKTSEIPDSRQSQYHIIVT